MSFFFKRTAKGLGVHCGSVVEYIPRRHEALGSIFSTEEEKIKTKGKGKGKRRGKKRKKREEEEEEEKEENGNV